MHVTVHAVEVRILNVSISRKISISLTSGTTLVYIQQRYFFSLKRCPDIGERKINEKKKLINMHSRNKGLNEGIWQLRCQGKRRIHPSPQTTDQHRWGYHSVWVWALHDVYNLIYWSDAALFSLLQWGVFAWVGHWVVEMELINIMSRHSYIAFCQQRSFRKAPDFDGPMARFHLFISYMCWNRTDQIIRAQVQKQAPKRLNFRTWTHIIPVVNRNHEGFQTNLLTTKIASFNIQHHTLHFTSNSEISLHTRSRNYYKPSL
jgi:hypothetical protein